MRMEKAIASSYLQIRGCPIIPLKEDETRNGRKEYIVQFGHLLFVFDESDLKLEDERGGQILNMKFFSPEICLEWNLDYHSFRVVLSSVCGDGSQTKVIT